MKPAVKWICLWLIVASVGCNGMPDDGYKFSEVTESQEITIDDFSTLTFTDQDGNEVKLADVMTRDYLVLVVTRGWYGGICIYCASQTSRWARRFDELEPYNAQLVVIFPTENADDNVHIEDLDKKIINGKIPNEDVPFPVLLDVNLKGVDQLGIRAVLAKPSTYIIDRNGRVRFAYVGESVADRPTVDSILDQLAQLNG
ncbi:MAG: redoxin domain-containing protein [Planctomycetota bacterium]